MKRYLLFSLLICSFCVAANEQIVRTTADISAFPIIKFEINVADPDVFDKNFFKIGENGSLTEFTFEQMPAPAEGQDTKAIFILMEDMTSLHHPGQRQFFEKVLNQTLEEVMNPGDKVNLALFDRSREGKPSLKYLLTSYTENTGNLLSRLKSEKTKNDLFSNQISSDIYFSLLDGMNDLKNQFPDKVKLVVLLSAGKNNIESTEPTADRVIELSTKYRIPVYSIQYSLPGWDHNRLIGLVISSYGKEVVSRNVMTASDSLLSFLNHAIERSKGRFYRLSYTTSFPKDGKEHSYIVYFKNIPYELKFTSPVKSIKEIYQEKRVYFILCGWLIILVIVAFGFLIFFAIRSRKRLKEKLADYDHNSIESILQTQEQKGRIEELTKSLEQEKIYRAKQIVETKFRQIINNGWRPRLVYIFEGRTVNFQISKPIITMGRSSDCDLIIEDSRVSEIHAQIIFYGSDFLLQDLNSTNGTIINNQRIEVHFLKNGDMITIGNLMLSYYL